MGDNLKVQLYTFSLIVRLYICVNIKFQAMFEVAMTESPTKFVLLIGNKLQQIGDISACY